MPCQYHKYQLRVFYYLQLKPRRPTSPSGSSLLNCLPYSPRIRRQAEGACLRLAFEEFILGGMAR